MINEVKERMVDEIAALSDPPDIPKFKHYLRTLSPFQLRERYEIIIEQQARDVRDREKSYQAHDGSFATEF